MDNVKVVAISSAIRGLGYSSIWIYSSIYMTKMLGLSTFAASIVFMFGGILSSFSQYGGGILGDKVGHKKVFTTFLFSILVMSLVLGGLREINSSPLLFPVAFGIIMILNGLQAPSSNALVSTSSSVQLKGFSIMRVGNNLGWGFGPAIGGFLLSLYGFTGIFTFFIVASIISFLIAIMASETKSFRKTSSIKFNKNNAALLVISICAMFVFMVQAQETISLSIYSDGIFSGNYYEIGIVYMANGILVALTQPIFYRISLRIGEYTSLVIGTLIYTLGFASYGLDFNLTQMLISTGIFTVGENLAFPTGYSIVASISRKERIGANIGLYNAFCSAGRSIGPMLGGYFLPIIPSHSIFWIYVTFPGFLATALLLLFRKLITGYQKRFKEDNFKSI